MAWGLGTEVERQPPGVARKLDFTLEQSILESATGSLIASQSEVAVSALLKKVSKVAGEIDDPR